MDVERGRTVPNWRPRRLGGGLGTTRVSGEEVNQKPGRYFFIIPTLCMHYLHKVVMISN